LSPGSSTPRSGSHTKSWSTVSPCASTRSNDTPPTTSSCRPEKVCVGTTIPGVIAASRSGLRPIPEQGSTAGSRCTPYCRTPRADSAWKKAPYCEKKRSRSASVAHTCVDGSTHTEAPPTWSMGLCV
jgi:hypothetical protein